jgi:transcriptional regulator with XRE-family HTH domain
MKYTPHKPKRYLARFDTETFMDRVNDRREGRSLTWLDLEMVTGIPRATLGHLFTGRVDAPGANILCALLTWLGETNIGPYMIQTPLDPEDE